MLIISRAKTATCIAFAHKVDQDQPTQNMQSDLGSTMSKHIVAKNSLEIESMLAVLSHKKRFVLFIN